MRSRKTKIAIVLLAVATTVIFSIVSQRIRGAGVEKQANTEAGGTPILVNMLESYEDAIGHINGVVRADRTIAHAYRPRTITVVVPDVREFTSHSERTTFWLSEGHVVNTTVMPMKDTAEFKEVKAKLDELLNQWEIDPSQDPNEFVRQVFSKWSNMNPPGSEEVFNPRRHGTSIVLSPKVDLDIHIRPGATGWYLAIDFSANSSERDRIIKEKEDSLRQHAEERLAAEVLRGAQTPEEQFARIDKFLTSQPDWFKQWIDSGGRGPSHRYQERRSIRAFASALADATVV